MQGGYLNAHANREKWRQMKEFLELKGLFQEDYGHVLDMIEGGGLNVWKFLDVERKEYIDRIRKGREITLKEAVKIQIPNNSGARENPREVDEIINTWLDRGVIEGRIALG